MYLWNCLARKENHPNLNWTNPRHTTPSFVVISSICLLFTTFLIWEIYTKFRSGTIGLARSMNGLSKDFTLKTSPLERFTSSIATRGLVEMLASKTSSVRVTPCLKVSMANSPCAKHFLFCVSSTVFSILPCDAVCLSPLKVNDKKSALILSFLWRG